MDKLVISVPSTIENNTPIIDTITEYLESIDCPMKATMQISVALDEIATNVASYAYEGLDLPDDKKTTTVELERLDNGVAITFIDNGHQYNPLEHEDPDITLGAEERGIGGLGILMVKKSMDKVEYSYVEGQNRFTMTKFF
ncbi:MAG: ATP-binding protein [Clostridia bacterium]|nr:ATP-binding protein [Clostridia bacterium]